MIEPYLAIIIGGAIVAGFVQGLCGFAFSLVSLSIWAWAVDPQVAAPMAVFGSLVGQVVALPLTWRGTELKRLAPFVIGGVIGVPLGIFLLGILEPAGFKLALGLFLVVYSPAMLFVPTSWALRWGGRWADGAIGWLGGIFGGIGGMAGGIPTLWCTLRGWDKHAQRAVFQTFHTSMHTLTLTAYFFSGLLTAPTGQMFLVAAPAMLVPSLIGARLYHRVSDRAFRRFVLILLLISGALLLMRAVPRLV